ncbi:hypothetical protein Acsp03_04850 [Actinomadura sp. NBRC 104412]|uniref:hypothetical protein n=1 Tax=Actinomadura sp. NBRC 104412 TaxID=3032203 RepID=UPI0024A0DB98|nr:hypothetical protein [Actinomadura sp. NBRC 104412]GLZ03018.1 hypothetical protein Acsp03_04850 [Actinomadura sp. NBRC 104412]
MEWGEVRAHLNAHRHELGHIASRLYPEVPRVEGTALLTRPEWMPGAPIPLESVRLHWDPRPPEPAVADPDDGLPEGYRTYADAMAALAPPKVFEDRPSYRLLGADLVTNRPELTLGPSHYFAGLNVGEAVAHELAADPHATRLPLRECVGDPCDLSRRTVLPAITTVTVTRSGSYVLHWRDPAKVVHAGGLHQVMPVGVFQPLGTASAAGSDLDLWRCMVREFSEELVGADEDYGPGFDQDAWPFQQALDKARQEGRLTVHCLGMGVDPLTLALDILTVAVFDDATFDGLFGAMVEVNAEGRVMRAAFDGTVPEPMQPAGAAALRLAWRRRAALRLA